MAMAENRSREDSVMIATSTTAKRLSAESKLPATPTDTIDLNSLFGADVSATGMFDLGGIGSTELGKLLEALPVPVLVINQWFCVAYANESCTRLSPDYRYIVGLRFTDLLPITKDAGRANSLAGKAVKLLEDVLTERKPRNAEAILEIDGRRVWARLHFRCVKINSERYIMVIIDDVTEERKQHFQSRKQEVAFRQMVSDLRKTIDELTRELERTKSLLALERSACPRRPEDTWLSVDDDAGSRDDTEN
jgi:hypothetical protein